MKLKNTFKIPYAEVPSVAIQLSLVSKQMETAHLSLKHGWGWGEEFLQFLAP